MILAYGDYEHEDGEVTVQINRTSTYDRANRKLNVREIWTIRGELLATSQDDIKDAIEEMEDAYAADGNDLKLYHNGGTSTVSAHALLAADCDLGPRVVSPPSFPKGDGVEYATQRTYEIVIEGDRSYSSAEEIIDYVETLTFTGGGPRKVFSNPIEGVPELYQIAENTVFVAVQQGSAIGRTGYPTAPLPKFSGDNINLVVNEVSETTPQRIGSSYTNFETRWRYEMHSKYEMVGDPDNWLS